MSIPALQYLWYRIRHPALRDFLDEGLGIAARASRAAPYWAPHLRCCKEFERQSCALLAPPPQSFTILGAGRLLDLAPEVLLSPGSKVQLVDADPAAQRQWRGFTARARSQGATVVPLCQEITGRLDSWSSATKRWLAAHPQATGPDFANWLDSLLSTERVLSPIARSEVVVSLNILSQIPIYWRERVLRSLRAAHSPLISASDELPPEVESALARTAGLLQTEHLHDLSVLGQRLIILITDVEFFYYQQDRSHWQAERALYGVELPGILGELRLEQTWLWHIAPQGIEQPEYGAIHRVRAYAITPTEPSPTHL